MKNALERIQSLVCGLKLDNSLLYLNHLLSVTRNETKDQYLESSIRKLKIQHIPEFVIYFVAKQLLLHASNLSPYIMDWKEFKHVMDLFFSLNDPIVGDPTWVDSDPTGFLERTLSQQFPLQNRVAIQEIGLALGLFRNNSSLRSSQGYNIKETLERIIGMSVEQFISVGFFCSSATVASYKGYKCRGTITKTYFIKTQYNGLSFCTPKIWQKFIDRVACNRDKFREICARNEYKVEDKRYIQYEFNPLNRFPLIEISSERYLAVDPKLLISRSTLGLFYDLFESDGLKFTNYFGDVVFDRLIGDLLHSVYPPETLWSDSAWKKTVSDKQLNKIGKRGDWAYKGCQHTVLIECKSLRPNLELMTYGTEKSVKKVIERIAEALEQIVEQSKTIQKGKWQQFGLIPYPTICVLITYGRINTANGPFIRKQIIQLLSEKGFTIIPPFVILSLKEFDNVIRLCEIGYSLDEVVSNLTTKDSFDIFRSYQNELSKRAVSSKTYDTANEFLESIAYKEST